MRTPALFWLMVSGVLGMATKFAEIAISMHYRQRDKAGVMRGGAMYVLSHGLNMRWLGVLFAINLQTSFLTPPFGFALFYLRGVAPPELRTADLYRGAVPFVVIQLLMLTALVVFPQLVWVP